MRRDARRNVERLTAAAAQVFGERGLDAPLDEIATIAGVSAGTLYHRFGGRDALIDAVMPDLIEAKVADARARAAAEPDAWQAFALYVTLLCEMQASDLAVNDAVSRRFPDAQRLTEICDAQMDNVAGLITRAHEAGSLRADFTTEDLPHLLWSVAAIIRATSRVAPDAWRRPLTFMLDGLRADAARSVPPVPPMTAAQVHDAMVGLSDRRRAKG
jgi:AcrR family transcriptional regulator